MDQLPADVLDAHGGLERWQRSTRLSVELAVGGFSWGTRGWPALAGTHTRDAAGIADHSVAAMTLDIADVTVEQD
jgi:hypothetical protein